MNDVKEHLPTAPLEAAGDINLIYEETNMTDITFNAQKREKAGKGAARACRREGRIPAVIYGGKKDAVLISLDPVELEKALDIRDFYKSEITIALDGKNTKVVCQDVQFHPVSDKPIHVDFMRK
ncbi:MAG: 50S ribosomal protein L25 [Alphaproteobacteria bacterium]|nr:50S ribosomal protein L25 [Alphaproteobacteria bacterium]